MIVSFLDAQPAARYDNQPWTSVRFEEAPASTGPWTLISTQALTPDPDPAHPAFRDLTTTNATLINGWYRLTFVDAASNTNVTDPVQRSQAADTGLYATSHQVRLALAPEGDTSTATAASLTDRQLTDAISEAQAEVDAALRPRHTVPMTPPPKLAVALTRDVAAYLSTLAFRQGVPLPAGHPVQLRYDRAQRLLRDLAAGRTELEAADGAAEILADPEVINPYQGDLFTLEDAGLMAGYRRPVWSNWPPSVDWS